MGFTEQNVLNPKLLFLKGSNLAPESVSMLRAAKTIVLQGCDVVNTLEHTGVMAAKRATPTSATYRAAGKHRRRSGRRGRTGSSFAKQDDSAHVMFCLR